MDNVQVSIKHISDVEKDVFVSVDSETVARQYDIVCNVLNSQVEVKGFRKGKITKEVLMQKFGEKIKNLVDTNLINLTFNKAINENEFELVGSPAIKDVKHEVDGSYNVSMYLEVKPKFEPRGHIGMHLDKAPELNIKDALKKRLDTFKRRAVEFVDVDRASQSGDVVVVSFSGLHNGEKFEGNEMKDAEFELGSGNMIEEFEAIISGMKAGEEKDAPVMFPDDYRDEKLAGKQIDFHVAITAVKEKKLPEVDDELAKKFGFGTLERMNEKFTEEIKNEHEHTIRAFYEDQIIEKLIDANNFSIPKTMLNMQLEHIMRRMKEHLGYKGDPSDELKKSVNDMAEQQLRKMIVLDVIFQKEGDNLNDVSSYGEIVERLAKYHNLTKDEFIKTFQEDPGNLAIKVREENVIDFILSKAEIA